MTPTQQLNRLAFWPLLLAAIAVASLFVGCKGQDNYDGYRYMVRGTHDKNMSTSGYFKCDSFHQESLTRAKLFTDGRGYWVESLQIRIYENPKFTKP